MACPRIPPADTHPKPEPGHRGTGAEVVAEIRRLKADFGVKCAKFSGAATIEILRDALQTEGIPTSARDVFVRGIPVEIDLLVTRGAQRSLAGLLYDPAQVAVVLEIKNSGSFGQGTLDKLGRDFRRFSAAGIRFAYITAEERRGFRWAPTETRDGFRCFTLAYHGNSGALEATAEWGSLVSYLRECIGT